MSQSQSCPRCGSPLPSGVLSGLCPACLLQQGAAADSISEPSAPFVAPEVAEIAPHFSQLEIISLIGKGGMGAVYKARQPALDRFVALKILAARAGERGFAERFTREARALARLNHPAIVGVHEFGEAGGLHYLMMEFVDGTNLRQLQQTGRLSPREALQIVPQICDALQYAHDEGVVHRDIKPENVLIDRKGRVKIADFGLAKILGIEAETLRLTGAGHVVGTPHYMAPEQVEHPQEVDHRADIYSLGVVFYEMLTGELPLGKFAPPSRKVRVDVRLDEVVLRALEKEPEMRFQQASQMKSGVESVASEGAAAEAATPPLARTKRYPITVSLAAIWLAIFIPYLWLISTSGAAPKGMWAALLISTVTVAIAAGIARMRRNATKPMKTRSLVCSLAALLIGGVFALCALLYPALRGDTEFHALAPGSIELIAISEHPSAGKSWWRPDGAAAPDGPFQSSSLHLPTGAGDEIREFVFRTKDPADAGSLIPKFHPSVDYWGSGEVSASGKVLPGYRLVAARLPAGAKTASLEAGIASGPWTSIGEIAPGGGSYTMTVKRLGHPWTITFLNPVETKDGATVASVAYTRTSDQTQIVAIDSDGAEHLPTSSNRTGAQGMAQLTATFDGMPQERIARLRFEARNYAWTSFDKVALHPTISAPANSTASSKP